jgi:gluconate 2-dehydrogenase gamma chain
MNDRENKILGDSPEPDEATSSVSRRDLLKTAGVLGIGIAIPAAVSAQAIKGSASTGAAVAYRSFSATQVPTVCAIVARLIPTDDNGPGAIEAGVPQYLDRLLGSDQNTYHSPNNPEQTLMDAYAAGLTAVDAYAQETHGAPFASLSANDQDSILTKMQDNKATGFTPDSRTFFNLIRANAVDGMFGDPYYGGNVNFVGWDLINFPGIRLGFTEEEQKLDVNIERVHKGTLDYANFSSSRKGM